MPIEIKDVEHIAGLARLRFGKEEMETFARQLGAIIKYIEKLNELQTGGIEPTSHPFPVSPSPREDRVVEPIGAEKILANAPEKAKGHFVVPRVIE